MALFEVAVEWTFRRTLPVEASSLFEAERLAAEEASENFEGLVSDAPPEPSDFNTEAIRVDVSGDGDEADADVEDPAVFPL